MRFWASLPAILFGSAIALPAFASTTTAMSYHQTGCYGSCIAYTVTVFEDGRVAFEGRGGGTPEEIVTDDDVSDGVVVGRHEYRISAVAARDLATRFRNSNLFALKDEYDNGTVDAPTYKLGFVDSGKSKKIWDNYGEKVGMPAIVTQLMQTVKVASHSDSLASGKEDMIELLASGDFDFRSIEAGQTLVRAIARGAEPSIVGELIRRGAPMNAKWDGQPISYWAVKAAVTFNDFENLELLEGNDAVRALTDQQRLEISAQARLCKLQDLKKLKEMGFDPVSAAKAGKIALLPLVNETCVGEHADSTLLLIRYFVEQGADVNQTDTDGATALFKAADAAAVDELVKAGADLNHLNRHGQSAVFGFWDEDVVLRLLEAGVKPTGKYFESNFWDFASSKKWSKVIAWLEDHQGMKQDAQAK